MLYIKARHENCYVEISLINSTLNCSCLVSCAIVCFKGREDVKSNKENISYEPNCLISPSQVNACTQTLKLF